MNPNLHVMTKTDINLVYAVEIMAYEYPWSIQNFQDCLHAGYHCWVWKFNLNVLGYGIMSVAAGECEILNLCTHPAYRRQGLGRNMLYHLLKIGKDTGVDTAFLEVREANIIALELYRQAGFNEIGIRRNYYPHSTGRMNAIMLAKML